MEENEKQIIDFITNGHKDYFANITIDCVIFGYHELQLKVLIGKRFGSDGSSFPGGHIGLNETLAGAANRILKDRTSLDHIFLQQFHTFGDSAYRVREFTKYISPEEIDEFTLDNWLFQRTFSVGFYALIDFSKVKIKKDIFFEDYSWVDINEVPPLMFDHNEMLEKALTSLRNQIYHQPIGYNLLPKKFTLPEIISLYETILNKTLDRRNFPKKLMSLEIITKLDEKRNIGQHRAPFLYKFDKEKYNKALQDGITLVF